LSPIDATPTEAKRFMIKFADTTLLRTAYCERGSAAHPPVLLLHGWPDDASGWDKVAARLALADFRTIAPYLRGFGPTRFLDASTPRTGQLAALGSDVLELADALGLERFAVVGHDWGARAAYIAATEKPERISHVIALSVGYGTNAPTQDLPLRQAKNYWYHWLFCLPRGETIVKTRRRQLCEFMWETWSPGWTYEPADFAHTAESFDNPDWAEITIHSYRHRWGHAAGDPRYVELEHRLSEPPIVNVPTLVLHGAADACNDPATSAGKERFFASRYQRQLLAGVGHFPQREEPDAVADAIIAWLRA
jgi:pimeloyl-ACP methyl ester carboxylesterase